MNRLVAAGHVIHDGLVIAWWGLAVTPTGAKGVWAVHLRDQRPVDGVAVWLYPYGYRCERDGATPCIHVDAVLRYEQEKKGV